MTTTRTLVSEMPPGPQAKKLRIACLLTRPALAAMAGVTAEEVSHYERGLPVRLDSRRRIMKALWAKKTGK